MPVESLQVEKPKWHELLETGGRHIMLESMECRGPCCNNTAMRHVFRQAFRFQMTTARWCIIMKRDETVAQTWELSRLTRREKDMKISSVIYRTAASTLLATLFVHSVTLVRPAAASPLTTATSPSTNVVPLKQAPRKKPVKKIVPKPTPTPPRPTPVPPAPTPTPKPAGDDCDCGL